MTLYGDQTVNNRSLLKRFSHRRRFELALQLLQLQAEDTVLDFGAGDGFMLARMLEQNPHPRHMVGYEPMPSQYRQLHDTMQQLAQDKIQIAQSTNDFAALRFNKITCLEVLEHLTEANQREALGFIRNALEEHGCAVISVPIEIGPAGLAKNMARVLLRQSHDNTSALTLLKSLLGLKVDRGNAAFISSHVGFDFRVLEKQFSASGFVIRRKLYSPLQGWGSLCNSQVLYVLQAVSAGKRSSH